MTAHHCSKPRPTCWHPAAFFSNTRNLTTSRWPFRAAAETGVSPVLTIHDIPPKSIHVYTQHSQKHNQHMVLESMFCLQPLHTHICIALATIRCLHIAPTALVSHIQTHSHKNSTFAWAKHPNENLVRLLWIRVCLQHQKLQNVEFPFFRDNVSKNHGKTRITNLSNTNREH